MKRKGGGGVRTDGLGVDFFNKFRKDKRRWWFEDMQGEARHSVSEEIHGHN